MVKPIFRFLPLLGYIWLLENLISMQVTANDAHDAEVKLRYDLLKNYTTDVPPPHNKTRPVTLRMDLSIISLKDLDAKTQTLLTEAWLVMKWNDSRLAWNPQEYSGVKVVRLLPSKIWQPDIMLYNSAKMSEMKVKTVTFMTVKSTGEVVYVPPVTLHSLCVIDNKYYPYDKHSCMYKFGSWTHSGNHINLELYNDSMTTMSTAELMNDGGEWKIIKTLARKTISKYECCEEEYMDVSFFVALQRRSPFYQVAVVCPLIAASFLLLTSFWVSPTMDHRIGLNIVALLTTLGLLMHLSSNLPPVGKYCPLILTFSGALLIISALATAVSVAFVTVAPMKKNDDIPEWLNNILQSPNMKFFCLHVKASTLDGDLMDQEDSVNLVVEDGPKAASREGHSKPNQWAMFFQLIDRVVFIVCFISIFATMIAASQSPDVDTFIVWKG